MRHIDGLILWSGSWDCVSRLNQRGIKRVGGSAVFGENDCV